MNKFILILLVITAYSFSQTAIPSPTGHPNAKLNSTVVNIGDFDGDGSDDLFFVLSEPSGASNVVYYAVYSMKKNQYSMLEQVTSTFFVVKPDAIGDFDGDKMVEFVIGNIIYKYSSTLTKKKI